MAKSSGTVVVKGTGRFIGDHLVRAFRDRGAQHIQAVDIKPLNDWQQVHRDIENFPAHLRGTAATSRSAVKSHAVRPRCTTRRRHGSINQLVDIAEEIAGVTLKRNYKPYRWISDEFTAELHRQDGAQEPRHHVQPRRQAFPGDGHTGESRNLNDVEARHSGQASRPGQGGQAATENDQVEFQGEEQVPLSG